MIRVTPDIIVQLWLVLIVMLAFVATTIDIYRRLVRRIDAHTERVIAEIQKLKK